MPDITQLRTPLDMFYHWENTKPDAVYLRQPIDGVWHDYSWKQVGSEARSMAAALRSIGIDKAGDRVSILADNCAHWFIADLAVMMSGGASAPAFTTMSGEDVRYILEHSGARVLFVGRTGNWPQVREHLPAGVTVIALPDAEVPGADYQWADLLANQAPLTGNPTRKVTDEITTIYTSGSTGLPKGVVYSFEGAGHIVHNLGQTFRMEQQDRLISYLPLAHGFERAAIDFMSLYAGCTVGFNENQASFAADMQEVRPTVFQCVPRLWNKFQDAVLAGLGGQEQLDKLLADPTTAATTISSIKQSLGLDAGRLLMTGSAPTPLSVHAWYESLDMPLCELYGQSEVLSGTSNLPWDRKPGTLGKPTLNTEIRIADNGEILIRAKAVMTGYLHEPEKTAQTLIDGWVHTGDQGEIDDDGFLKITGRVKEIYKTARGKYVAPLPIESMFAQNPDLEQMCLIGSGLPQTVLVVQLSDQGSKATTQVLEQRLREHVLEVNRDIAAHARIAAVVVTPEEWSSTNGLATHTLKIKRAALEKQFGDIAQDAFLHGASVTDPLVINAQAGT